jgi:23S rRNA-/tRNA-specific pseudouridylate synthase/2-polyprenyl-3-methyl-5-hydroxy-6-metoxy-1,4-benzoquinol methylase
MAPPPRPSRPFKGRKSNDDRPSHGPSGSYKGGAKAGPPRGGRPSGSKRPGPPPLRREDSGPVGPLGPGVRIIHEDDDLIVVDKPPHLLTVDMAEEGRDNLAYRLKKYLTAKAPRLSRSRQRDLEAAGKSSTLPGPLPGIIHRLDKEASGLLVFSKSRRGFGWLKDDFKNKRVHRMYIAVVEGVMGTPGDAGTIQTFMREGEDGRVTVEPIDSFSGRIAGPDGSGSDAARLAVTHYRIAHVGQGRTLVQLRLSTGRKNQIRAHLAYKGYPIVGDERFGARTDPIKRVALHATEMGFTHAGTGQPVRFNSPAPPAFYTAVDAPIPAPVEVAHAQRLRPVKAERDTSWNTVAKWYDTLQESGASDHYTDVIIPGTLRMVGPHEGMRILDVASGQGVVSRAMSQLGASVTGVDAAPDLVAAANSRGGGRFVVGDARKLGDAKLEEGFDAATCVMALGNIEPIDPVFEGIASLLKPGGGFVFVISHPSFRAPGQTFWGWDESGGNTRQFRRVDGYLSAGQHRISMHPGDAPDVVTWTFHRPLQAYIKALAAAGFVVEALEEWAGQRVSQPGPKAAEENRARREIPLFMAVRAVKRES